MQSSRPSISVIIVNWNGGELLKDCITHLLKQSLPAREIIVVDNASSDHSIDDIRESSTLQLKKLDSNIGFAAANNLALQECRSDYVALLNPDALADKDWLLSLARAAKHHPEVAAFGSRQMGLDRPDIIDGLGDVYHISGLVWRRGYGRTLAEDDLKPREIFSPCACAALYRRDILEQIGGFDEDYFCYLEDVDLGFRLRLTGYVCRYVPEAIVHHAGSASTGGQHSDFSVYHGHRNLTWTFVKNMPPPLFWPLLPVHLLLNLITMIYFTRLGQGPIILKAKKDALTGLGKIWQKRRQIQSQRKTSVKQLWRVLNISGRQRKSR